MEQNGRPQPDFAEEIRRFVAIQVRRYLVFGRTGCFSGPAERDAVLEMIGDAWVELRCSGVLEGLGRRALDTIYHTTIIVFPTFVADGGCPCVKVDFVARQRIGCAYQAIPGRDSTVP